LSSVGQDNRLMSKDHAKPDKANRYSQIIETVFLSHYKAGDRKVSFSRDELIQAAEKVGIERPKTSGISSTHSGTDTDSPNPSPAEHPRD
jgi:hypothetical protein